MMDLSDYVAYQQMLASLQAQEAARKKKQASQGGSSMNPQQGWDMYQQFSGQGGGTAAGTGSEALSAEGSSMGAYATPVAYIAAALAGGKLADLATGDREQNGVHTGTIFEGKGFNDPFLTLTADKVGWDDPTPGEQLDADLSRKDSQGLKKSIPEYLMGLFSFQDYPINQTIDDAGFLPDWSKKGLKWLHNPFMQALKSIF